MKRVGYGRPIMVALVAVGWVIAGQLRPGGAEATEAAQDSVRTHAEKLAEAASKEFGTILERQALAQAQTSKPGSSGIGLPLGWFQHSAREFQELMGMLAGNRPQVRPWDPVADAEKKAVGAASSKKPEARPREATPLPPQPVAQGVPAGTKKPTEERRLAEVRRGEGTSKGSEPKKSGTAKPELAKSLPDEKRPGGATELADTKASAAAAKAKDAGAERPPQTKASPEAKRVVGSGQDAQEAALAAARVREVERAAAAKAAVDAASAADTKRQRERVAAKTTRLPVYRGPESKRARGANNVARTSRARAVRGRSARTVCRAAGVHIRTPGWYVVQRGDTLSMIAKRHYGTARRYWRIRRANRRTVGSADKIYPCQRLYLPRRV